MGHSAQVNWLHDKLLPCEGINSVESSVYRDLLPDKLHCFCTDLATNQAHLHRQVISNKVLQKLLHALLQHQDQ